MAYYFIIAVEFYVELCVTSTRFDFCIYNLWFMIGRVFVKMFLAIHIFDPMNNIIHSIFQDSSCHDLLSEEGGLGCLCFVENRIL